MSKQNVPPAGAGERLQFITMDRRKVRAECSKVLEALSASTALDGLSRLELTVVMGYVLGIYTQGAGAKLKPDVPLETMLPAVWFGYQEAEAMGLGAHIRDLNRE